MGSKLTGRAVVVASIPWVGRLKKPRKCDGHRWNHMPLKAVHDPELLKAHECKKPAYWTFKALKRSRAQSGNYCWSHLVYHCIHGDMDEDARLQRWWKKRNETTPSES
jgi:hypothetical protein